ncbi:MAG: hypothetical protein ACE5H3_07115, partial [Planctomycetota bacterium]
MTAFDGNGKEVGMPWAGLQTLDTGNPNSTDPAAQGIRSAISFLAGVVSATNGTCGANAPNACDLSQVLQSLEKLRDENRFCWEFSKTANDNALASTFADDQPLIVDIPGTGGTAVVEYSGPDGLPPGITISPRISDLLDNTQLLANLVTLAGVLVHEGSHAASCSLPPNASSEERERAALETQEVFLCCAISQLKNTQPAGWAAGGAPGAGWDPCAQIGAAIGLQRRRYCGLCGRVQARNSRSRSDCEWG